MEIHLFKMSMRSNCFCDYTFDEDGRLGDFDIVNGYAKTSGAPSHKDLLEAMDALKPHAAALMGFTGDELKKPKDIEYVIVTGIEWQKGSTINMTIGIRSPFVRSHSLTIKKIDLSLDEHYPHLKKLKKAIDKVKDEVLLQHDGKYGDGEQLKLALESTKKAVTDPGEEEYSETDR